MSIYKGSKLVAGSNTTTVSDIIKLFKHDWYDYSFSDLSWVRADDFEWIYADRYPIAYEHLYADFISTSTWQSETIGSYTIQFKIAPDGHRITDHANEGIVQNIYGQSGVAWYYIIDTVNERFKLPRTKHGMTGLRDEVGKYVPESLPDHTHTFQNIYQRGTSDNTQWGSGWTPTNKDYQTGPASENNPTYQDGAPVQERATQQYLYFYLGQFPVSALVNPDIAETKANTSMNNLNSVGRNIANWSSNVTNCITEIPQDIKLELKDGTLTLKAGSKVYVPNGAGKFDVVNIASDKIVNCGSTTGKCFVRVYPDGGTYGDVLTTKFISGSDPSGITAMFYNTTTNKLTWTNNGVSDGNICSLPIAEITVNNGKVISIDQVFNGFGYIGSTIFALPDVKGLIPNGRNKDGSLKNIEFTTNSVLTYTNPSNVSYSGSFIITNDLSLQASDQKYWKYNQQENLFKHESSFYSFCEVSFFECSLGKITSFTFKTTFHALDYNDKGIIAGWGIPDYTAGIDITTTLFNNKSYTAPTKGVLFNAMIPPQDTEIKINGYSVGVRRYSTYGNWIPTPYYLDAGDVFSVSGWIATDGKAYFFPLKGDK